MIEVSDSKNYLTPLPYWSGTDAVLGSLDLAIHAIERTIDELKNLERELVKEQPSLKLISIEES